MDRHSYKTVTATPSTIKKEWVLVDARDKILGRLAAELAMLIRGKRKPAYTPHMDTGDHVVVINAEKVRLTGKKWTDRVLFSHSGYPGSQREQTPSEIRDKYPERLIEHAVKGMLPKNRMGRRAFGNLHVYVGENHPHEAQQPKPLTL